VICLGPAARLWAIWQNGKRIFVGPIDPDSHPSGTTLNMGREGSADLYWGQHDQPVNSYLGGAGRVGISSRWPFFCYVVWRRKRLGPVPQWPLLEYEIEVRPHGSILHSTAPWIEGDQALTGASFAVQAATNGIPGVGTIEVAGDQRRKIKPGVLLRLTGNAAPAADYTVLRTSFTSSLVSFADDRTLLYFREPLIGLDATGSVQLYVESADEGANGAHLLSHVLHGPFPNGLGLDPDEFNLDSLEDVGETMLAERIPTTLWGRDGDEAVSLLAGLMQDLGVVIGWEIATGRWRFTAVRKVADSDRAVIGADVLLPPLPVLEAQHGDRPSDRIVFLFLNKERNFRNDAVPLDDDGQAEARGNLAIRRVQLPTITDLPTASRVAGRREQEELAHGNTLTVIANRSARLIVPGHAIDVTGIEFPLRVLSIRLDALTGKVTLDCIGDVFGADVSEYEAPPGAALPPPEEPELDLAQQIVEVPSYLSPGVQTLVVPRIRAHASIVSAAMHLSRDDLSYTVVGFEDSLQSGGLLIDALPAGGYYEIEDGPTFSLLGPDASVFQDLDDREADWRAGRQVVVLEDELLFVRKMTLMGGNVYRMTGVIRARYDTEALAHAPGVHVFVLDIRQILRIQDILLEPGALIYLKVQPRSSVSFDLAEVPALTKTLHGKGVAPMPMPIAWVNFGRSSWAAGANVVIEWSYRSSLVARTGAGMQGAGRAVSFSPPEGEIILDILKNDFTLVRTVVGQTGFSYTYTNAQMVTDFGSEPTIFRVRVRNVNAGRSSGDRELQLFRY
jgi:hypothetical protein